MAKANAAPTRINSGRRSPRTPRTIQHSRQKYKKRQTRGKRRYNTYRAMFFSVVGSEAWNVEVHAKPVSAAMNPVPMKSIRADPKTSLD